MTCCKLSCVYEVLVLHAVAVHLQVEKDIVAGIFLALKICIL